MKLGRILLGILALSLAIPMSGCGEKVKAPEEIKEEYSEELVDVFKGCIRVVEENNSYLPLRFSAERLADYKNYPKIPYAPCTSGVYLEFYTDAEEISFSYIVTAANWLEQTDYPSDTFDILENGELQESIPIYGWTPGEISYSIKSEGETKVTVCLPVYYGVALKDVNLGNFRTVKSSNRKKLLVFGDSISQGLFASGSSKGYIPLVQRELDIDCLNLSVGGEMFRPEALDEDIPFTPDQILVVLGTNDLYFQTDITVIGANIKKYFERLREIYPDTPVTVITPFWQTDLENDTESVHYKTYYYIRDTAKKEAEKANCTVYDGLDLIPHEEEYFSDTVHPNDQGHEKIAEAVIEILKPLL